MGETTTNADALNRPATAIESHVVQGDLAKLSAEQRVQYYQRICQDLSLNPLTRPFDYLTLNGKLVLYAKRDATDQIRSTRKVSVTITNREHDGDLYIVTARASLPDGRVDESVGAVSIAGLKGEAMANAIMKAETKAKRRVTLSIAGLGMMDESEISSALGASRADVDMETGEVLRATKTQTQSNTAESPHKPNPPKISAAESLAIAREQEARAQRALETRRRQEQAVADAVADRQQEQAAEEQAYRPGKDAKWWILAGVTSDKLSAAGEAVVLKQPADEENGGTRVDVRGLRTGKESSVVFPRGPAAAALSALHEGDHVWVKLGPDKKTIAAYHVPPKGHDRDQERKVS